MHHYSLKISLVSLILINSASFGMLTTDYSIHKLPEEILRHIFVVASPSIQNQLKNSCKVWHAIGTKTSPNMYKLIDDESFKPSEDDWHYMMMHAAFDKKIDVMVKILNRTQQRKFGYDLSGNQRFYLCDMPVITNLLHDDMEWKKEAPEKLKELDVSLLENTYIAVKLTDLLNASFTGNIEYMLSIVASHIFSTIDDAIYMAVYNDNHSCIKVLSVLRKAREPNISIPLNILLLAIRKKKRKAFEALVRYNVYGCLHDVRLNYAYGGINTTILDELYKIKDIPHIDEYIELCKKLGGKDLKEMGYSENYKDNDLLGLTSTSNNCVVQ